MFLKIETVNNSLPNIYISAFLLCDYLFGSIQKKSQSGKQKLKNTKKQ